MGRRESSLAVLAELARRAKHEYVTPYGIATVYGALGDRDHRYKVSRPYPEEAVDLAPVGQSHTLIADLHPGRSRQERAAGQCAPRTHQTSLSISSFLRSRAKAGGEPCRHVKGPV